MKRVGGQDPLTPPLDTPMYFKVKIVFENIVALYKTQWSDIERRPQKYIPQLKKVSKKE